MKTSAGRRPPVDSSKCRESLVVTPEHHQRQRPQVRDRLGWKSMTRSYSPSMNKRVRAAGADPRIEPARLFAGRDRGGHQPAVAAGVCQARIELGVGGRSFARRSRRTIASSARPRSTAR